MRSTLLCAAISSIMLFTGCRKNKANDNNEGVLPATSNAMTRKDSLLAIVNHIPGRFVGMRTRTDFKNGTSFTSIYYNDTLKMSWVYDTISKSMLLNYFRADGSLKTTLVEDANFIIYHTGYPCADDFTYNKLTDSIKYSGYCDPRFKIVFYGRAN